MPGQPNGPIVLDEIWSPAQWNAAWASVTTDIAAAIAPLATTSALGAETTARMAADALLATITSLATETAARIAADALLAPLTSPTFLGNPTAPTATPGDNDTSIASTAFVTAAIAASVASTPGLTNIGRNKLHNPLFGIAQRGAGAFIANGYSLDRWLLSATTDTQSVTQATLADADRTAIGDEEAEFALQNVFTSAGSAGSFNLVSQRIVTVRRLSSKTVVVSFWAKAASGTPNLGVSIDQNFGSGGSTAVNGSGTAVAISTTWTRYTVTIAIPSESGKTVGAGSYTALNFWYSSGTTNATRSGSVGVQSGTIAIWGAQLEIGTSVTPLEKLDPEKRLADCFAYYYSGSAQLQGTGSTGTPVGVTVGLPAWMRAAPTVVATSNAGSSNVGSTAAAAATALNQVYVSGTVSATGNYTLIQAFTASADL
jgi:hypothetical protein